MSNMQKKLIMIHYLEYFVSKVYIVIGYLYLDCYYWPLPMIHAI